MMIIPADFAAYETSKGHVHLPNDASDYAREHELAHLRQFGSILVLITVHTIGQFAFFRHWVLFALEIHAAAVASRVLRAAGKWRPEFAAERQAGLRSYVRLLYRP